MTEPHYETLELRVPEEERRRTRTDRARSFERLADAEAEKRGHIYVGTGHQLLALIKADGIAATVLARHGVTYDVVSREFDSMYRPAPSRLSRLLRWMGLR